MWLLKLHIALSILSVVTFIGFSKVFKEQIKENGWLNEKKKKKASAYLVFFVPIMNILVVLVLFMMIFVKEKDFEAVRKYVKEESEE